jgi:uncharacterized protein YndB with AHSA1/START domain
MSTPVKQPAASVLTGRTRVISTSLFHTTEERDRMLSSGMQKGLDQSYAALDRLLVKLG